MVPRSQMTQGKGSELVLLQEETLTSSPLHLQIKLQYPRLGEGLTFYSDPVNSNPSAEVLSTALFEKKLLEPARLHLFSLLLAVQSLSCVRLLRPHGLQHNWLPCPSPSPGWSLLKLMSNELVMPSNHLILCCPLLFLPLIFPSIRVFSNESVLCITWPKYWSFSFSISPSNEYSELISLRIDWFDLLAAKGFSRIFSNTIVQKH